MANFLQDLYRWLRVGNSAPPNRVVSLPIPKLPIAPSGMGGIWNCLESLLHLNGIKRLSQAILPI